MNRSFLIILSGLLLSATGLFAQKTITVYADKPYAEIAPTMWGLFFEDISFAADGGIYAEMVKNRSFEFPGYPSYMMGWTQVREQRKEGRVHIMNRGDGVTNARYASFILGSGPGAFGLKNEGFRGMGVRKNEQYRFTVDAMLHDGSNITMMARLVDTTGNILGETSLSGFTGEWSNHTAYITATETNGKAEFVILLEGEGVIDLDMISLFPVNTWNKRMNGMRADLVQLLADMKPGFLRFPGGCIVEGHDLSLRYQWKTTVGPVEDRKLIINRWNTEFMNRHTPDYFQSFGLGFYEYFLLAKDLNAEPLPILNAGMACQYNTGELVPMCDLHTYIQDAIDLIEFANGPVTSEWGKLRNDMGHPEPFNLKYIGIGNEQWGPQYIERYAEFARVIREKHPEIKLVSGAGPTPEGAQFEYLWSELRNMETDLVDEHYYRSPQWFFENAGRYNDYDREGPKAFPGEYAAHIPNPNPEPTSRNTWFSAIAEAAFLTGFERNADIVHMTSYAPLFAHVDAWQWRPNLIWFDNLTAMPTPNYYVQKLYSTNAGTHVVPLLSGGESLEGDEGIYGSSVLDKVKGQLIMKLVNAGEEPVEIDIELIGINPGSNIARIVSMQSSDTGKYNTIESPEIIVPVEKSVIIRGNRLPLNLEPFSFQVVIVKL